MCFINLRHVESYAWIDTFGWQWRAHSTNSCAVIIGKLAPYSSNSSDNFWYEYFWNPFLPLQLYQTVPENTKRFRYHFFLNFRIRGIWRIEEFGLHTYLYRLETGVWSTPRGTRVTQLLLSQKQHVIWLLRLYICCLFLSMRRACILGFCTLGSALGYCYKTMLKYSLKRG